MAVFNPVKTRTWSKNTPADGDLIDDEFDRQYENFQYLKDRIDTTDSNLMNFLIPIGSIIEDSLNLAPASNFKDTNAQAISRTSFVSLWDSVHRIITGIVPATDRINSTNHGCIEGQLVKFSFTGGGVTALTKYYVRNPTANDFQISITSAGSVIDLTSSQTGDMITNVEYSFGDGSTTYNLPDRRGIFARGAGVNATRAKAAGGNYDAGVIGTEGQDQLQAFGIRARYENYNLSGGGSNISILNFTGVAYDTLLNTLVASTAGTPRTGNETTPAYVAVRYKVRVI
ncbi:hypothetical protein [Leptospira yasudae]|uniref:Phage tail protein n=1 Tax=Leptospira yasudae TaxID=2202201 RepID=A0A6N4QYR1_9LEPT|nr:hypothetical protein [Leptospira yasudae]TGL77343.1 hypothetical protein EHQ77_15965 [Leptospira yasudae]TGL78088.1 hypothetical protein EHQ72_10585 [Leptospira yasudae]TGL87095.1 hypothetical protein EHQ83_04850 [Leptospira yasudae]